MSLVPYTITALELNQADATASGKQVIIGATCSMFSQPSDLAVLLYDDAAGSNGSTAKTTGSLGNVIVYVPQGKYKLRVNTSDSYVTVATDSPVDFDTFASLQASNYTQDYQKFTVRERANAPLTLKPAGYAALAGDATLANGRVAALQFNLSNIMAEYFGAKGDGVTDDTAALQNAINRGNGNRGATLNLEPKQYEYSSLTITNPIKITGVSDRTNLRASGTTGTSILISTPQQCIFKNVLFSFAETQVSGEYIRINSGALQNTRTRFNNCVFGPCYDAVVTVTCVSLRLTDNYFVSYQRRGLTIENTVINDAGNHVLRGNTFDAGAEAAGVGIFQKNSGGLRCLGNKFLAGAYQYLAEIEESSATFPSTSVLVMTGNSFENCTNSAIAFNEVPTATFKYINVTGNQFTLFGAKGFSVSAGASVYIDGFLVESNIFNMATLSTGISLASCKGGVIGTNLYIGNGTSEKGLEIASDCSDIDIGLQKFTSVQTEYDINASAADINFTGCISESGSQSSTTNLAYGSLFASAAITVTFAKNFPKIPSINLTETSGGGVVSAAVVTSSVSGFQAIIYGITNGGAVGFNWEARL
jgi:hypothetical protein